MLTYLHVSVNGWRQKLNQFMNNQFNIHEWKCDNDPEEEP